MSSGLRFDTKELIFKHTGNSNRFFSKLILKNTSEKYIGYQLKGNNIKRYIISKPSGKLGPLSIQEVGIEMALNDMELNQIESISDKFCCFYSYIDETYVDMSDKELEILLKNKQKNKSFHKLKIRSRVVSKEETPKEDPVETFYETKETIYLDPIKKDHGKTHFEETIKEERVKSGFNRGPRNSGNGINLKDDDEELFESVVIEQVSQEKETNHSEKKKPTEKRVFHQV